MLSVILAIILIASIIAGALIYLGSQTDKIVSGNHIHTAAKPATKGVVDAKNDYVKVAESDTYELYYYEPRFSIKLVNKETGAVIESTVSDEKNDGKANADWTGVMQSGLTVGTIEKATKVNDKLNMNTSKNEITTWYTDDGIYAEVSFPDAGISLGVQVSLQGDELVVRVPDETIREEKDDVYIYTICVFQFLGYTYMDEQDGYMFVPDGNGALIYLDDKEGRYASGFSSLVYGTDVGLTDIVATSTLWERYETVVNPNPVLAPIFGMAHLDDQQAFLGIVESGDERLTIEAQPNGARLSYNRCFPRFMMRDVYSQPLSNSSTANTTATVEADRLHSDLTTRYLLLSGEDANYVGMAKGYRQYLLDTGKISRQNLAYNTRVDVLGSERESFLMGTTAVPMTTVEQLRDIFAELRREGVKNVLTAYRGWQKGGLYNTPVEEYKADSAIGGNSDLTKAILEEAEQGNTIYLYDNALEVNAKTHSSTYNVMKKLNKRTFEKDVNGQVYDTFYYLMPRNAGEDLAALVESMNKENLKNIAVGGITENLFSYSSKGNYYSRTDTMDMFIDTIDELAGSTNMVLETPNQYLWKYASAMLDMPLDSSDYLYIDEEIPFLSIVLKGIVPTYSEYVNFEANKTENFLKMVEAGMYPSFYVTSEDSSKLIYTNSNNLYSLEFESYRATIAQYDRELRALAEMVGTSVITNHEILDNGLVKVTYENGVRVYVNYTNSTLTADGVTVDALSYKVGE